jgi:hypothetical protein
VAAFGTHSQIPSASNLNGWLQYNALGERLPCEVSTLISADHGAFRFEPLPPPGAVVKTGYFAGVKSAFSPRKLLNMLTLLPINRAPCQAP